MIFRGKTSTAAVIWDILAYVKG